MNRIIIIGLGACLYLALTLSVSAFSDGDLQLWNTDSIEAKITKNLKVKVEEELRFGDNISEIYYTHIDGGFAYNVTEGLALGVNYRQVCEKKKGKWKEENRPHVNGTLKWRWQDIKFSDRSRLELRIPEDKSDKWRYRNKLTVTFPWKWTQFDIQPYVADEIFIDFHGEKLNRNRLYGGIKMKLIEHLKAELFYLWQSSEDDDDWIDWNVIGIKAKLVF